MEKARVVIKMTQPDPEGQRDRRRLWVDKTAIQKPPPLGITMKIDGNDYDFEPPKEPDTTPRKRGPVPEKLEACKKWLERATDAQSCSRYGRSWRGREGPGFPPTRCTALKTLSAQMSSHSSAGNGGKLPLVDDPGVHDNSNSDNSDKVY